VEAGWMTATSVFAMQFDSPEFRNDIEAARKELAGLRAHPELKSSACQAETETLSKNPY
jgi:hypothetical protein